MSLGFKNKESVRQRERRERKSFPSRKCALAKAWEPEAGGCREATRPGGPALRVGLDPEDNWEPQEDSQRRHNLT